MKTLRARWTAATVDDFLARHGELLTAEQVFLVADRPLEPGTRVRFELLLDNGSAFLAGTGIVEAGSDPAGDRPGMVLRFEEIDPQHAGLIARLEGEVSDGTVDLSHDDDELFPDEEETRPDARPPGFDEEL